VITLAFSSVQQRGQSRIQTGGDNVPPVIVAQKVACMGHHHVGEMADIFLATTDETCSR